MHCNLRPSDIAPVVLGFYYGNAPEYQILTQCAEAPLVKGEKLTLGDNRKPYEIGCKSVLFTNISRIWAFDWYQIS